MPYSDAVNANTNARYDATEALCGDENTYTNAYVVVPGFGDVGDYDEIDVTGKIALVQRGGDNMTFATKADNAKAAGAVAIIIYNNVSGSLTPGVTEDPAIPMVGISKNDGQKFIDSENKTITFGKGWSDKFEADDANDPSSFSSWGPAPDLTLKPEIAAPGGNIRSSVIGGGYDTMSGTSMATPHMAGMGALVRQYLMEDREITDSDELHGLTDTLLMSTAVPTIDDEGNEYSPRKQGAGIANVYNAVTTKAYITVPGSDRPKIEMGESDEGVYTLRFEVKIFLMKNLNILLMLFL